MGSRSGGGATGAAGGAVAATEPARAERKADRAAVTRLPAAAKGQPYRCATLENSVKKGALPVPNW